MRAVLAAALALAALSGTPAAAQEDPAPRRMTLAQDCAVKLAGKFMGLEDAAALGKSFRFRIDLTLK